MPAKLPTHRPRRPSDVTTRDQGNQRQRVRFLHTGSAQWRAIRKAQLERFPLCEDCGAPALEVDHNTDDTSRNVIGEELSSLCKPCHSKRTRERQSGRARRMKGCDANGMPLDPSHPWNREEKSLEGGSPRHARPPSHARPRIAGLRGH